MKKLPLGNTATVKEAADYGKRDFATGHCGTFSGPKAL